MNQDLLKKIRDRTKAFIKERVGVECFPFMPVDDENLPFFLENMDENIRQNIAEAFPNGN